MTYQPHATPEPLATDTREALPVVAWTDDWEDEPVCARCGGDGMDPWNDYLFECPECQGRQQP